MLDDLDVVSWGDVTGAYGPAADAAMILRGLASPDEDIASEALDEFFSTFWHQGTVYPVTAAAVPFLVDLVTGAAVHYRNALCFALGGIGDPHMSDGAALPAVKAALGVHSRQLLPLLADADREVREAATYAVAHSGDTTAASAVVARWDVEEDPGVRAGVVLALSVVDPGVGLAVSRSAAATEPFPVPLAAAHALLDAGQTIPADARDALADAIGREEEWEGAWAESFGRFDGVMERLDAATARSVVSAMDTGSAEGRIRLAQSLAERSRVSRAAAHESVDHFRQLLVDDDDAVVSAAIRAAADAGHASSDLAPMLARIALGDVADHHGPANQAIAILTRLRDRHLAQVLGAAWDRGRSPDALRLLGDNVPPFDPAFLAIVRDRLAHLLGTPESTRADWATAAGWPQGPSPLVQVLGGWGPAAADAVDVLVDAIPAAPFLAPSALASIGPAARGAESALRDAAHGDGLPALQAAHALYRLSHDPGPLVAVASQLLDSGRKLSEWDLNLVADAGAGAAALIPRLRPYLAGAASTTYPDRELQVAAARIVWRATADVDAVTPTLDAVLRAGDRPAASAARLAAELPPDGVESLVPALKDVLGRGETARGSGQVPAARALWRSGTSTTRLIPALLEKAGGPWSGADAVDLLAEMGDADAIPGLQALADQDARLVTSGTWDDLVWEDNHLRQKTLDAIGTLRAVSP